MKNPLTVISPYTHLAGHYWAYTVDMTKAFMAAGREVKAYAALPPRNTRDLPLLEWTVCAPWVTVLQSLEKRNRGWGSKSDALLRNLEFYLCLRNAVKDGGDGSIFCVESRHQLLLKAVMKTNRRFSTLCVGAPDQVTLTRRADLYRRAFATGRLEFIVETEAVRQAWEPLAGEHAVHIPAALTERTDPILDKAEARMRLGLPREAFIPLFFGTHREGKDYRTAIEAAKLSKSQPTLLFAGPLISGNDPEALLLELGYDHAVSWKRYYPDDAVALLFDACDAVMLPYERGYTKGSGVLLQACKYGKPVIASDTGHLAEFVSRHSTGLLYKPGNTESLASVYDRMAEGQQIGAASMKLNIQRTVLEYNWKKLVERYLEIFDGEGSQSIKHGLLPS
ncbi:MAG: glycosyltransferase family 4 protein [bacterium]